MPAIKKKSAVKPATDSKKASSSISKKKKIPVRKISTAKKSSLKSAEARPAEFVSEPIVDPIEDIWLDTEEELEPTKFERPQEPRAPLIEKYSAVKQQELKSRSVQLYRKISVSFGLAALVMFAAIFYFAFVKVNIEIVLKKVIANDSLVVDIYNQGSQAREGAVIGSVSKLPLTETKSNPATGINSIGAEATGTATIINTYNKNQPLVAKTRLLAPDGQLFRLEDTVNVPANGSIQVAIYADQPSQASAIAPTKFTIPGLSQDLQAKIYAETSAPITYQEKTQKYILQADLDAALADLKAGLINQAQAEQGNSLKQQYNQVEYQVDQNSIVSSVDGKVNDQKDSFNYKLSATVVIVAFNDQDIIKLAQQKLKDSLSDNQELVSFNQDKMVYSLNNFDPTQNSASVNVAFDGTVLPKQSAIIDKQKLVGLSASQLNDYLASIPELASFKVSFSPPFIKNVPSLTDRIIIKVVDQL